MSSGRALFFVLLGLQALMVLAMLVCVLSAEQLEGCALVFVVLTVGALAVAWWLILRERRQLAVVKPRLLVKADVYPDPCEPESEGRVCGW